MHFEEESACILKKLNTAYFMNDGLKTPKEMSSTLTKNVFFLNFLISHKRKNSLLKLKTTLKVMRLTTFIRKI